MQRAVFLDRDGTLNIDVGYTHRVADLQLFENVVEGLLRMQALGYRLFIVTNQSGVARKYFTLEDMHRFNQALLERLAESGVRIQAVYYCDQAGQDAGACQAGEQSRRKPGPGMLLEAAGEQGLDLAQCWMIGDKKSDILAGRAAGCRTILVLTGLAGEGEPELAAEPDFRAADLSEAAQVIEMQPRKP